MAQHCSLSPILGVWQFFLSKFAYYGHITNDCGCSKYIFRIGTEALETIHTQNFILLISHWEHVHVRTKFKETLIGHCMSPLPFAYRKIYGGKTYKLRYHTSWHKMIHLYGIILYLSILPPSGFASRFLTEHTLRQHYDDN